MCFCNKVDIKFNFKMARLTNVRNVKLTYDNMG